MDKVCLLYTSCWKDCRLQNLPFASFTQNLAWVATSLIAGVLIAWMQMTLSLIHI